MSEPLYDVIPGTWAGIRAAAATRRDLYVLDEDSWLYRVDPVTGETLATIERGWQGHHLAALGDHVFLWEPDGALYRVDPDAGTYDAIGDSWHDVRAVCAQGDRLYAIDGRELYAIDPETGDAEQLDNTWDTRHLIGHRDHLFAWDADNGLYRVAPGTGEATPLAGTWPHTSGVASAIGRLYAVDNGILYEIDPETGDHEIVTDRLQTRLLVGCGSSLYSFEQTGELFRMGVG